MASSTFHSKQKTSKNDKNPYPTLNKDEESIEEKADSPSNATPNHSANASTAFEATTSKKSKSTEEIKQFSREEAAHNAIALTEAKHAVKELCKSTLHTKPTFSFGKHPTKIAFRRLYICQMVITPVKGRTSEECLVLGGTFQGSGYSKRLAKLAAYKSAMEYWEKQNVISFGKQSFSDYVGSIATGLRQS